MKTMKKHPTMDQFTLEKVLGKTDYSQRKTKIVCTIGPACWSVETLSEMIKRGMTVARLNFSHGDHKSHGEVLERVREAARNVNKNCAIMLDTKGPEIRTGFLQDHKPISLDKGQILEITTDYSYIGHKEKIACSYKDLPSSVKVGGQILIADGTLVCKVLEIFQDRVKVEVENSAKIGEKKNMNLPGCSVNLPTVTDKDKEDILEFGLNKGINMIALSFTRSAKDIEDLRELMGPKGKNIKIIAKIENQEGMNNYDEILNVTDGIMVARGDLGMEIPPQKVFVAQKWMIRKANDAGKPVITATQMMESIIVNPRPTRAEASDVANAVLDGTDCVMLSGETANGNFPLDAVETMAKICSEAELCFDNESYFRDFKERHRGMIDNDKFAMAIAAVQLSLEIQSNVIFCLTETGSMARTVAMLRPRAFVITVGTDDEVIKGLSISRGVINLMIPENLKNADREALIDYAIKRAKDKGFCYQGQKAVFLQGFFKGLVEMEHYIVKLMKVN